MNRDLEQGNDAQSQAGGSISSPCLVRMISYKAGDKPLAGSMSRAMGLSLWVVTPTG